MNEQLKPYSTVEEIAKKHGLEVSFIQKQLDMGAPIEHEHTKDQKLAIKIALQHLDEIPDYYTRLKKMEADAKKRRKKFKDVKEATDGVGAKSPNYNLKKWFDDGGWVQAGGKYDGKPCAKQPGQKTKPYCRDPDDRAAMSKDERNKRAAKKRKEDPNPNRSGEANMVTQEAAGEKDACYKKVKSRYKVWPSAYASGALVKCRKVGAGNWGESLDYDWDTPIRERPDRYCPKCNKLERRNECKYGPKYWDMFSLPAELISSKKDYNVIMPHPANESKIHEDHKEIASGKKMDDEGYMARVEFDKIERAVAILRKNIKKGDQQLPAWVQSKITRAADFIDTASEYLQSDEDVSEACWRGYKQVGMKKKGKKVVPNCVPESISIEDVNGNHYAEFIDIIKPEPLKASKGLGSAILGENVPYSNWREEISEDWQKVNRKDKTDGLSPEAVKAYRRENPGSKLQTAVTEKNPSGKRASRRKSFCSRMKGMKSKLTSAETSRDPDSRINKALRRWNCN